MESINTDLNRPSAVSPIPNIDYFLSIAHPLQIATGFIYFDFQRINNRFEFVDFKAFYLILTMLCADFLGNIIKIYLEIQADNLSEAQQVGAVCTISSLCFLRGVSMFWKRYEIADISNEIDRIFPQGSYLQRRMELPKIDAELRFRFRFLHNYASTGLTVFIAVPVYKYLHNYDTSSPLLDEYHQHASWVPFGIKHSYRWYPAIYVYESLLSFLGICCLMTWDHIFTIVVSQLNMHYDFVCVELSKMDASDTKDFAKSKEFYKTFKELIAHQQHLNRLARDVNNIFDLSIMASDILCAASICFHIYLIVNAEDVIDMVLFLFPGLVLIWLIFDISKQGQQFEIATGNIKEVLYSQNWYEGSVQYRKLLIMYMQHANDPVKLSGFNLFEVNMEHFQKMMTLAYQLFTFLQSRG